tara:strand:+ start:1540 stop:1998 length:459 start_codon:yes stop_codon:yes gene_type:complete
MYDTCNDPDIIECSDERCWVYEGCRYLDKCIHKLVGNVYDGYTCACPYIENGNQVYMLPECIIFTNSPTLNPTEFPSVSRPNIQINDSILENNIEDDSKNHFEENLLYYILAPCVGALLLCMYFHKRIYRCIKIDCLGREDDDDDDDDDGDV